MSIFTKRELNLKKQIPVNLEIEIGNDEDYTNFLIDKFNGISFKGLLKYSDTLENLTISGKIKFELIAIDAKNGGTFPYHDLVEWEENYTFNDKYSDQENLILGDQFELKDLIIEQILLNIPVNLSNNCDTISKVGKNWSLLSEDQFNEQQENRVDERWSKLLDLQEKDKKQK
ncbi:hypothetical protein SSABA_v1c06070 [Spiroplasma sabaudiense Ar-1343]|uniref:DUF177 domain-containing protein n=1 Tax=Spiroplasma sabaudiense Ar-1343 TaxID=1276257 RepID=W6AAH7_9MOLU|nr:DUF177 domain-containing protein [Spiroplasma sabaudiense]AHI54011.1 hypothetical protein SSABA_v1c06070 [Spiroplasma sabaudiense Ar-1343]